MNRKDTANRNGDNGRVEKRSDNNRTEANRGNQSEVRPELGALGWAERAKRLFGAMTLHA